MPAEGTEFVSLAQLKDYDTNRVATGLGLKLDAPASAGTDGQMLVYGASGNQWTDVPDDTTYSADDETIQLSGTQFSVKDGGITAAKIASGAVTADKMASGVIPDVSDFVTQTQVDEINETVATTKWLKPTNKIPSGTDLDTLTEPGSWYSDEASTVTNKPSGVTGEFLLYVYSGGGVVNQELRTPTGMWWRWKRDGENPWSAWARSFASDGLVPVENGGTGANNAAEARNALGLDNLYARAPYVRSKSATGALYAVTVVKTITNQYLEVMSASQVRSTIGREPEWGRDFAVVVNGDESASTNQIHTILNISTHDIDARVWSETGGAPVSGAMRLDVLIYAG